MANSFNFADWVAMRGLTRLTNKLVVAQFFNTTYNKEFTKAWAVGDTVKVPLPQRYTIRDGMTYTPQALSRPYTTVSVDQPFGIDFEWPDIDKALYMERGDDAIAEAYIDPAMDQIAQEIDSRAALWAYQNANNIVGVLGTDPTSLTTTDGARQRLVELAGWMQGRGERGMILPPSADVALVNAGRSIFNPASEISRQYKDGTIGRSGGFDWYESMSLYSHTAGTYASAGSFTVSGNNQSGSTLLIVCTSGDVFNKGDVFSIDNTYAVNPSTRRRTTAATDKQFVVTATTTASAATVTLPIQPAIVGPGSQYQNVDALPVSGAAVTFFPGTSSPSAKVGVNGLALTSDAFLLVGVPLEKPANQQVASMMRDPETGLAIRFVRSWDPVESKMINRFDTVIGFGNAYSDNCCVRILCA